MKPYARPIQVGAIHHVEQPQNNNSTSSPIPHNRISEYKQIHDPMIIRTAGTVVPNTISLESNPE